MTEHTSTELVQYPGLPPDDWAHAFLDAYSGPKGYGTLSKSARAAQISVDTVARRRQNDTVFDELMTQAEDQIRDLVRHEVFRRALEPGERPVFQRGEMVTTILEYDNRHLEWLAERFLPEEFHLATKIELTAPGKGPVDFTFRMGDSEEEIEDAEVRDVPALEPGTSPAE